MLGGIWAALLQLAVVLRLATKVRGGTEGGSGHREQETHGSGTHETQVARAGDPWVKQSGLKGTACGTGQGP